MLHKNLTAVCVVVGLLAVGGNCRGALAQAPASRALETLAKTCENCGDLGHQRKPLIRQMPMTTKEWALAYDECIKDDTRAPVILATRTPGLSAGIVCVQRADVE